jgi:hypothetical protein
VQAALSRHLHLREFSQRTKPTVERALCEALAQLAITAVQKVFKHCAPECLNAFLSLALVFFWTHRTSALIRVLDKVLPMKFDKQILKPTRS